jgi:transposase InsO family protein
VLAPTIPSADKPLDDAGWLYLAIVIDLFARKVIGLAMGPIMTAELVCEALNMAISQRQPDNALLRGARDQTSKLQI